MLNILIMQVYELKKTPPNFYLDFHILRSYSQFKNYTWFPAPGGWRKATGRVEKTNASV